MATKKKMLQAAAGNAGGGAGGAGGAALNVEDVFSTYLYDGTGSTRTITNDIDLDGEGGLVWIKRRDATVNHYLFDTERGTGKLLRSDTTFAQTTILNSLSGFTNNGFTVSSNSGVNRSTSPYASWTFRKAPKFFDVVTYSGTGVSGLTVDHNLGSVPGMIIIKGYDDTRDWVVYHRGVDATNPEDYAMVLQKTDAREANVTWFNDTAPTDTQFTVGNKLDINRSGYNYVAYLFAHNDGDGGFGADGDADIIKCGVASYPSSGDVEVDLGFEPQWVLLKDARHSGTPWWIIDTMRGWSAQETGGTLSSTTGGKWQALFANTSGAEVEYDYGGLTATGFKLPSNNNYGDNNTDYIYIAIRRGTKVPESADEVFDVVSYTADNSDNRVIATNNRVDAVLARNSNNTSERGFNVGDRLRGLNFLGTAVTNADGGDSDSFMGFDHMKGFEVGNDSTRRLNYSSYNQIAYSWTKAPGFFDVVAYTGNGTAGRTVSHNLGVAPELLITKSRTDTRQWRTYVSSLGPTKYLELQSTAAVATSSLPWNDTAPTATDFTLGATTSGNASGQDYIAYLFASLPGISKVGSYTGNNGTQTIDCGFTSGARFVLIKRADGSGDWCVWDTERGIVAGNDSRLALNLEDDQNENVDEIDPHSSGFIVNDAGGGQSAHINGNNDEYIFYAIA